MVPLRLIFPVLLVLIFARFGSAQTLVNSTYTGQCQNVYSDPNCWTPPEVPINSATRQYNVTVPGDKSVHVNVDATVSNLNLAGYADLYAGTLKVLGTTIMPVDHYAHMIMEAYTSGGPAFFDAGTLANFSNHILRGRYFVDSLTDAATFQFNGADIETLSEGSLALIGPLARITDEFGNDGLRNLARIDGSGTLELSEQHNLTVAIPFTNDGILSVGQIGAATIFAATGSLTNFDPADRTLHGGTFRIGNFEAPSPSQVSELRFKGADIVNNAGVIQLSGFGRITDLAGNDGLRNLAHNLAEGSLRFNAHDFTAAGSFQNDGLLFLQESTFSVTGAVTNFDPSSRTISGGSYELSDATLRFPGADIVRNAASLTLTKGSDISDLVGGNGLRNFSENLASGTFVLGPSQTLTTGGNLTNAGRVETMEDRGGFPRVPITFGELIVAPGFFYTQTAGTTVNAGTIQADEIRILGGMLSTTGLIKGNLSVSNAVVAPAGPATNEIATLDGNLTLDSGSHLRVGIGVLNKVETWSSITGKVALGGSLDVTISDQTFAGSDAVITVLHSDGPITGSFVNAADGSRFPTADGKGSFVIVYEANAIKLTQFQANPPPAQLLNISSRAFLFASKDDPFHGQSVLIGGFIITGTEPKKVALRGIGPSLAKAGVSPVLEDPVLELHGESGAVILANDNWRDTQASEIVQDQIAPQDDRESVIITTLAPASYTVVLREKNGSSGNGLVEVYDLSGNSTSKLANISARGFTNSSNPLIGGIIAASGQANAEIVVRALGPGLGGVGVNNALADPTLELRDKNGSLLAFNDDWRTNGDELPFLELVPHWDTESAMRISLPAGNYTAIVRGKGPASGVALVEFYDLRR